jgi:hypothetical protein
MKFRCKVHQMRTALVLVLVVGCGKPSDKVTREQCSQVADHVAAIMVDHCMAHTDECWDAEAAQPRDGGVPEAVTKATFKSFLDTPAGKTWLMQRQGQWRSINESAVPSCIKNGSSKLVNCLLATKTRDDVAACDQAK